MSLLENAKMPSLKDKINALAEKVELEVKDSDSEEKVEIKVKKGRRLNK